MPIRLDSTGVSGRVYAIQVQGSDVLAAGVHLNTYGPTATVWKNGIYMNLTSGSQRSVANGLASDSSNIYVTGVDSNLMSNNVACYWKNGTQTQLSGGTYTRGICLSGSDVFIGGISSNGTLNAATYWKNGNLNPIGNNLAASVARGIAVSGSDVYLVGFQTQPTGNKIMLWKNGIALSLTDGTRRADAYNVYLAPVPGSPSAKSSQAN